VVLSCFAQLPQDTSATGARLAPGDAETVTLSLVGVVERCLAGGVAPAREGVVPGSLAGWHRLGEPLAAPYALLGTTGQEDLSGVFGLVPAAAECIVWGEGRVFPYY